MYLTSVEDRFFFINDLEQVRKKYLIDRRRNEINFLNIEGEKKKFIIRLIHNSIKEILFNMSMDSAMFIVSS